MRKVDTGFGACLRSLCLFIFFLTATAAGAYVPQAVGRWVGTWATAPQIPVKSFMPYNNNMTGRSVRQIVKVSVGGDIIRLQLSNELSTEPVEIRSVYVATSADSFAILPKTARYLKFKGHYKTVIPAGKAIFSDALQFRLEPMQRLAITINYTSAPAQPTVHMGSRTTSYILKGVTNAHSSFADAFRENHWFNISAIDVWSSTARAVAIIGNSITDGKNSTDNAQNRWPDMMSEYLQIKYGKTDVGVLNLGIGNNRVALRGGFGTLAKDRFRRDILGQRGVGSVIIFEGVNDIGNASRGESESVALQVITALERMAREAKDRGLKVYLGTIMPFEGAGYYNLFHEAARETINEWIRTQKVSDGVLDFDALMRDRQNPHRLQQQYQSDWLHPNAGGYRLMGQYAAEKLEGKL